MSLSTPITSCRLCSDKKLSRVLELAPTPAGDHYLPFERNPAALPRFPLNLNQCTNCGHVQLEGLIDPEYIYKEYTYTTSSSLGLADHFRDYAASTINRLSLKPGSLIVEIGSNDGTMLKAFQDFGMKVIGIDPAQPIATLACSSGIPTLVEFFSPDVAKRILSEFGHADLIIANNVFANVSDPRQFTLAVRELLSPSGTFALETGYLRYLADDVAFDNIYHEHLDYHAIRPLIRFFNSIDMSLIDVHVSNSKGSSIRCFVCHSSSGIRISKNVDALVDHEIKLGYQSPQPYSVLARRLDGIKTKLHSLLKSAKSEGKTIAGFGASVGITTMLFHWQLGPYIDMLLDDNPKRHGLHSPGLSIPVRNASSMGVNPPDLVVLLAWRYAEPIFKKHGHWTLKGSQFLQVLPDIKLCQR